MFGVFTERISPIRCKGKYYAITYSTLFQYVQVTCTGEPYAEYRGKEALSKIQELHTRSAEAFITTLVEQRLNGRD